MKKKLFIVLLFCQQFLMAQVQDFSVVTNQGDEFVLSEVLNNGQFVLIDFLALGVALVPMESPSFRKYIMILGVIRVIYLSFQLV